MKLVACLGNPGPQYRSTRHNAGWLFADHLLKDLGATSCQSKFNAEICEVQIGGEKVLVVKPQTFMNSSGTAVSALVQFYKLDPSQDLVVIHDELDLPLGEVRASFDSRAAGNNGVQSTIDELGHQQFHRIRIGIETRASRADLPTDAFVLQKLPDAEHEVLVSKSFPAAEKLLINFLGQR